MTRRNECLKKLGQHSRSMHYEVEVFSFYSVEKKECNGFSASIPVLETNMTSVLWASETFSLA